MKSSSSVELLADESLDDRIIRALRGSGFEVRSVREDHPGTSDRDVMESANSRGALLLTEDSDFGTWVFAHKVPTAGILYLRYRPGEHGRIANVLIEVLRREGIALHGKFVTLTPQKSRFRAL